MKFTPRSLAPKPVLSEVDLRNRWLDNYSQNSRNENNGFLTRFCEINGTDAVKVLQEDNKVIEGFLIKYYRQRETEHRVPPTISKEIRAILGYFKSNRDIPLMGLPRWLTKTHPNWFEGNKLLTHDELRAMIRTQDLTDRKAVICFLAQTGQRVGILTGLKWKLIENLADNWGLVNVPPKLLNILNQNVNKHNRRYKFLIHPETMSLIRQIPRDETDFVWHFKMAKTENARDKMGNTKWGKRRMQEVVEDARDKVPELREVPEPTSSGRTQHKVHTHTLRPFWKDRMQKAGVNEVTLQYLMGHKIRDAGTYDRGLFTQENLLTEYKKAEPFLGGLLSGMLTHNGMKE
jgi:integrase